MALSDELRSEISGCQTKDPKGKKQMVAPAEVEYEIPAAETAGAEADAPPSAAENSDDALQEILALLRRLDRNDSSLCATVDPGAVCAKDDILAELASLKAGIEGSFAQLSGLDDKARTETADAFAAQLKAILEKQERTERLLTQALKENTNFQVQVRQGMQHDLDILKEQQSGEQFNPILKEIATVYVEYQCLLDEENMSPQIRQNLTALFEQLEDILGDYGAEICRSEAGAPRQTRVTKIIEKVPTADAARHNTVARSRKSGVVRDRTVLYPEFVDVYIFDPLLVPPSCDNPEKGPIPEEGQTPENDRIGEEHADLPQNSSQIPAE